MTGNASREQWYAAVLVVEARTGAAWDAEVLLDHQVRLIRAVDAEQAYARALALGAAQARSYRNPDGDEVVWRFAGLADLAELAEPHLADGTEVYAWRSEGEAASAVVPKERLTVFWAAANDERKARELLD